MFVGLGICSVNHFRMRPADMFLVIDWCSVTCAEPTSIDLHVDGTTDKCSLGEDINFKFTGFSVTGKVPCSFLFLSSLCPLSFSLLFCPSVFSPPSLLPPPFQYVLYSSVLTLNLSQDPVADAGIRNQRHSTSFTLHQLVVN